MPDRDFEAFATTTMNLEAAIADFLKAADKAGMDESDVLSRITDAIYNASDDKLKVTIMADE